MAEKTVHQLMVAQDRGGTAKRIFHYIKPEHARHFSVRVRNLITQSGWGYDKYHQDIEDGKYVLIFSSPGMERDYTKEIEITAQSSEDIFVVFSWSEFAYSFSAEVVSESRFKELADEKRLGWPDKFQGY